MFAYVALYAWPIVAVIFFRTVSRPAAVLATIIAGYLLLPERLSVNLPALPALNKESVPVLVAFLILLVVKPRQDKTVRMGWLPQSPLSRILIVTLGASALLTVVTNGEPLVYGDTILQGLRLWDGLSGILSTFIVLLPFLLGRKLFSHPDQQRLLLISLMIAGCAYSFLALYEIRMSPQLNQIVYGFFPSSWLQSLRDDSFRPVVFLRHGLWLAAFFSTAILAAFSVSRLSSKRQRWLLFFAGLWLLIVLALSSSLSALIITLVLIPVVLFVGSRNQLLIAAVISGIVLVYPMLRSADMIPVEHIRGIAESIDPNRAASFSFRIENEDRLLEKALQKPAFGWGGWGRNLIFDETGRETSITDGYWIIIIGQGGWIKYLGEFGLLCLPIMLAVFRARKYGIGLETSALAIVLSGNLIDLIPNATITPITWLIAGSLWGRLELKQISTDNGPSVPIAKNPRKLVRSRFAHAPVESETINQTPSAHARFSRQTASIKQDSPARSKSRPKNRVS